MPETAGLSGLRAPSGFKIAMCRLLSLDLDSAGGEEPRGGLQLCEGGQGGSGRHASAALPGSECLGMRLELLRCRRG